MLLNQSTGSLPSSPHPLNAKVRQLARRKACEIVGKAGLTWTDVDDITQDLCLDVIHRWPKYRSEKAKSKTFVTRLINHKLATILRYRRSEKRNFCRCISLNIHLQNAPSEELLYQIPADVRDKRTGRVSRSHDEVSDLSCDLHDVIRTLPWRLQELCKRLGTESVSQIAREMGIPRTTLQEDVRKIRHRFEDAGLRPYL